ncbi:MAG: hypothetical protein EOP56_00795 [Sphingobacteriales bacterium]|nr:MAG: hypothetical protein EOP56_00795 [Sphingobacteriales bacterium]
MPEGRSFDYLQEFGSATYHMIVLGQFYEPIDMSKLLAVCSSYVDGTSKEFNDPAGHYLIFFTDLRDSSSYVFTNRLGTYHMYHSTEAGVNALGTYYLGLAKTTRDKQLDWEGITGFLGMGFFQDDTTYLKNIKVLLPASCYRFDRQLNLISHSRYWNWSYDPKPHTIKEYTEQLHNAMTSSISYAISGKRVALPISGGLDSRTLAGIMTASGTHAANNIWSFSYGYTPSSVETRIAGKIASSRNIPFDSYTLPNYLFDKMEVIKDAVEMFQYVDGTRQASMKELLEEKSDLVIGGHWGDVWLDDMGITDNNGAAREEGLQAAFGKKIIKKGSEWLLDNVSGQHFANGRQHLEDYFRDFADQYRHIEDADFVMKIFKTDQWSFRWTLASIRMYQAAVFPVLPFYDKRVVDLFLQIPTSVVAGRQLQIDYLKQYHPDLAKITWQEYGNNLYWYKHFNNRNIAYRAIDKIRRSIKGEQPITRNWEIFYLNDNGRRQLEKILLQSPFRDVVPESTSRALLNDLYRHPNAGNGYAISMLHTFARFIEAIA